MKRTPSLVKITSILFFLLFCFHILVSCSENGSSDSSTDEITSNSSTDSTASDSTASDSTDTENSVGNTENQVSSLTLGITNAPIDSASSLIISIKKIEIKKESEEEWIEYFNAETIDQEKTIDLLTLTNGIVSLFDTKEFEPSEYGQIRLYLSEQDDKNTITLDDGTVINLTINAGIKNNGIKLVSGFEIKEGIETKLTIDFDVRKSIVVKGGQKNPKYALKPTLRLINNDVSGNIILLNVLQTDEIFYLYEADYDVSDEANATVIDDNGTEDTADDEEIDQPFANAVSSSISFEDNGIFKTVFSFIPYGTYDIYKYDADSDSLISVQSGVSISAEDTDGVTVNGGSGSYTWTLATDKAPWASRYLHSSVVFNNKMWVLGGTTAVSFVNDVWYSSDGISWT